MLVRVSAASAPITRTKLPVEQLGRGAIGVQPVRVQKKTGNLIRENQLPLLHTTAKRVQEDFGASRERRRRHTRLAVSTRWAYKASMIATALRRASLSGFGLLGAFLLPVVYGAQSGGSMSSSPGIHRQEMALSIDSSAEPLQLRFSISIPTQPQPSGLVVALHYAGHSAAETPYFGEGMLAGLVEPALGELGVVIIAPDCPDRSWSSSKSEEAVLALIEHVQESYSLPESKVVLTGYSMGGRGTWFLVSRHPGRFAAAIPMAGSPRGADLSKVSKTPLYAIHSRNDSVVPVGPTEEAIEELRRTGADSTLILVDDISHYETHRFLPYLSEAAGWLERVLAER